MQLWRCRHHPAKLLPLRFLHKVATQTPMCSSARLLVAAGWKVARKMPALLYKYMTPTCHSNQFRFSPKYPPSNWSMAAQKSQYEEYLLFLVPWFQCASCLFRGVARVILVHRSLQWRLFIIFSSNQKRLDTKWTPLAGKIFKDTGTVYEKLEQPSKPTRSRESQRPGTWLWSRYLSANDDWERISPLPCRFCYTILPGSRWCALYVF